MSEDAYAFSCEVVKKSLAPRHRLGRGSCWRYLAFWLGPASAERYFETRLGSSVGVVLGAFLSSFTSGVRIAHDTEASVAAGFFGGFLTLSGARLAGGCASGHGLSGIAHLSSASLVSSACMFVGANGSRLLSVLHGARILKLHRISFQTFEW